MRAFLRVESSSTRQTQKSSPYGELIDFAKANCLCALELSGLHALGAYVGALNFAIDLDGDFLHVRTEHAIGHAMRVADVMTRNGGFAANFTNLRHIYQLHVRFGG